MNRPDAPTPSRPAGRRKSQRQRHHVGYEQRLLGMRAVTTRLRRIPGAVLLLDGLRRHYRDYPTAITVPDFDGSIRLQVRLDEHMGSQVFWYGSYSLEILRVLERIIVPGMTVIDAGANIGEVSLFVAKRVGPGGRVYSFEPVAELTDRLRRHVSMNGFDNIEVVQSGLSDRAGQAEIYGPAEPFRDGTQHAGLSTLYANSQRGRSLGTIPLTTLDEFVEMRHLPRLDLVKVDVEGAELPVLRGARAVLAEHRPWLVVEVQQETSEAAGYDQREILAFLGTFGYSFARIGRRGRLSPLSSDRLQSFQNVLGIPPDKTLAGLE